MALILQIYYFSKGVEIRLEIEFLKSGNEQKMNYIALDLLLTFPQSCHIFPTFSQYLLKNNPINVIPSLLVEIHLSYQSFN